MATFRKMSNGHWRAEIVKRGKRKSKVLPTKTAAKDWAAREEYLIANSESVAADAPLSETLTRYAREVSPTKRGVRWEQIRLAAFEREDISKIRLSALRPADIAEWRDNRLKEVRPGTVLREMQLLSAVLSVAVKEWGLIPRNPMQDVRRPKQPAARDRMVTQDELDRLAVSAGADLTKATARAFHAFLFAIETGMRAGEILGLTPDAIDMENRVAHLPMTKNGTARNVPLSSEAVRLLEALPDADPVFGLNARQLDALWRKLRDRAGVENLTFHDSRHVAIVRLSRKLDVLDLARMVGHRNISQLMTYYSESAASIAKRLD
ncbi:tyrosine-type recombinase/integrase [Paracoccus seriniphilus]|uniref:tyrosine-type recombinase/integrase n=1 Tax=Paracoccus seriniphilus TaxID=184748 RepID=UPI00356850F0